MKELIMIQQELKVPKAQFNSFGKYKYRKCEDILEALKPILAKAKCTLTISDEIVQVGDRYYVRATAILTSEDGDEITSSAYAREADKKAGMDESQITGTASSYARKYALNGLFCIDDTMDEDTDERHIESNARAKNTDPVSKPSAPEKKSLTMAHIASDDMWNKLAGQIYNAHSLSKAPGLFDPIAWVRERSNMADDVASILREKYLEYYCQKQKK